ncbi:MAG: hypothetical protein DDT21_02304 [Syntrophomonadaceae bacterium]|nr:hypothetical protein [Bacillota bacterium]
MTDAERIQRAEKIHEIIQSFLAELARVEHFHPVWPGVGHRGDHVWAAAIVEEERGELQKAAMDWQAHGRGSVAHIRQEAEHLGAMAVRFLLNLDAVERQRINEAARQDLQEEHGLNDSIWWSEDNPFRYPQSAERLVLADYTEGCNQ